MEVNKPVKEYSKNILIIPAEHPNRENIMISIRAIAIEGRNIKVEWADAYSLDVKLTFKSEDDKILWILANM